MSGGYFNDGNYVYHRIHDFVDELESALADNYNEDGDNLSEETLGYLRSQLPLLKQTASIMRRIDYLYSGDLSEESFMEAVKTLSKPKNLTETLEPKAKYISKEEYAYRYGHLDVSFERFDAGSITWVSSPHSITKRVHKITEMLCIDHRVTRSTRRLINSFNWTIVTEATVSLGAEIVETTTNQI
jgi:hypothetical protein